MNQASNPNVEQVLLDELASEIDTLIEQDLLFADNETTSWDSTLLFLAGLEHMYQQGENTIPDINILMELLPKIPLEHYMTVTLTVADILVNIASKTTTTTPMNVLKQARTEILTIMSELENPYT